jgi:hypothetical protein
MLSREAAQAEPLAVNGGFPSIALVGPDQGSALLEARHERTFFISLVSSEAAARTNASISSTASLVRDP